MREEISSFSSGPSLIQWQYLSLGVTLAFGLEPETEWCRRRSSNSSDNWERYKISREDWRRRSWEKFAMVQPASDRITLYQGIGLHTHKLNMSELVWKLGNKLVFCTVITFAWLTKKSLLRIKNSYPWVLDWGSNPRVGDPLQALEIFIHFGQVPRSRENVNYVTVLFPICSAFGLFMLLPKYYFSKIVDKSCLQKRFIEK